uniref:Uncharacterized protein n=1 Tax=Rhizophora mucronata TaxID=61149 RepID=A0A2P2IV77_RHIMU
MQSSQNVKDKKRTTSSLFAPLYPGRKLVYYSIFSRPSFSMCRLLPTMSIAVRFKIFSLEKIVT